MKPKNTINQNMSKKNTALQTALEDIKGYKNFGKVIDIDFVVTLIEKQYLELEAKQLSNAYEVGKSQQYENAEDFLSSNYLITSL